MNWYLKVLNQYADFSGRARRKEYWMFVLINILISIVLGFIDRTMNSEFNIFTAAYGLIVLIPGIAVSVRRLHDIGKSGWMILIGLVPIIGGIWLLVLMVNDSEPGANKWGENPKEAEEAVL